MKIAVTGGNGRFGRVVVKYLAQGDHTVLNIDRVESETSPTNDHQHVRFVGLDLSDLAALTRALDGCDAVVHLAAIPSPINFPAPDVYVNNTVTSYNVLFAASKLGIRKVCLASSVNAVGGAYSRAARYDYFPVDEQHPTYNEDVYSLSKWVMEMQADSFARRHNLDGMTLVSLRFHGLHTLTVRRTRESLAQLDPTVQQRITNHLWGYTDIDAAARACGAAIRATYTGHEVFFIVAPTTVLTEDVSSLELAQQFHPNVPINGDLSGNTGFYNCAKAGQLLGWRHEEF